MAPRAAESDEDTVGRRREINALQRVFNRAVDMLFRDGRYCQCAKPIALPVPASDR